MKKLFYVTAISLLISFKGFAGGWDFWLRYAHNYHPDTSMNSYNFVFADSITISPGESLIISATLVANPGLPPPISAINWTLDGNSFIPNPISQGLDYIYFIITTPGVYETSAPGGSPDGHRKFTVMQGTTGISSLGMEDLFLSIYPNPYSNATQINYTLDKKSNVNIQVYNNIGQKIETLVNADQIQGDYVYAFSAKEKGYKAGIYFLKIIVDGKMTVKRIIETD